MPKAKPSAKPKGKLSIALKRLRNKPKKDEDPDDLVDDVLLFEDDEPQTPPVEDKKPIEEPKKQVEERPPPPPKLEIEPPKPVDEVPLPPPPIVRQTNERQALKANQIEKMIAKAIAAELAKHNESEKSLRQKEREERQAEKKQRQAEKAAAYKAEKAEEKKEIQRLILQREAELNKSFANHVGRVRSRMF